MSPLFSTQVGLCRVSPLWLQDQCPPRRPTAWEGVSPQEHMAAEGYRPCGFPKKLLRFPLVAAMAVWSWVQKGSICVFPLPVVFSLWEIPSLGFDWSLTGVWDICPGSSFLCRLTTFSPLLQPLPLVAQGNRSCPSSPPLSHQVQGDLAAQRGHL